MSRKSKVERRAMKDQWQRTLRPTEDLPPCATEPSAARADAEKETT